MLRSGCEFRKLIPKRSLKRSIETESERNSVDHFRKVHSLVQWSIECDNTKTLVWLVFVLVRSLFCNMATKGKQLRFNQERERERSCFSCGRRGRRVLEFSYVGTQPWTKLPGSLWPCTLPDPFAGLSKKSAGNLSNSTERERTGAGSNLGQTSCRTRRTQASSSSWSRQTEMGAERPAAASPVPLRMWEEEEVLLRPDLCLRARSEDEQWADPSAPGQDDGSSWTTKPSNKPAKPTNEMQNSFRPQPATRRRRPYSNPVG